MTQGSFLLWKLFRFCLNDAAISKWTSAWCSEPMVIFEENIMTTTTVVSISNFTGNFFFTIIHGAQWIPSIINKPFIWTNDRKSTTTWLHVKTIFSKEFVVIRTKREVLE